MVAHIDIKKSYQNKEEMMDKTLIQIQSRSP